MSDDLILGAGALGFPWATFDPFLFCVHHEDFYPAGNEQMGPKASLKGRRIGMDFDGIDGWRMYHGDTVPGFPRHPHRGFETVTLARRGFIDHADSLGATARFGEGDVQWMTAGRGVEHCEMFPLRDREGPNTAELFQIWLNLPRASKMVEPHFTMLWSESIPRLTKVDVAGRKSEILVAAGSLEDAKAPAPPPDSWAADPRSDLAIWTLKMEPRARLSLPPAQEESNRTLYFFRGDWVEIGDKALDQHALVRIRPDRALDLVAGEQECELLLLQGRPIGEPVYHQGPFVMNSPGELKQAFLDYRQGTFGKWPWPKSDPVHPREKGRFAIHADGREESP